MRVYLLQSSLKEELVTELPKISHIDYVFDGLLVGTGD